MNCKYFSLLLAAFLQLAYSQVAEWLNAKRPIYQVYAQEGYDALFTCVVRSLGQNTVVWRKVESNCSRWRVLTAGHERVTLDTRVQVIHANGVNVWVLAIRNATENDADYYACGVNSSPVVQIFYLSVSPSSELPAVHSDTTSTQRIANYNYTDCCIASNVKYSCLKLCSTHGILDSEDLQDCESEYHKISKCLADGRNNVPCCIEKGVTDIICQGVCRGEFPKVTDNIKTHFNCAKYSEIVLACIVEGIEILPSQPLNVQVTPLSANSFGVEWIAPYNNPETVTEYIVNVTMLQSFDPSTISASISYVNTQDIVPLRSFQVNVKVSHNLSNYVVVKELVPFTMYEVTLLAKNKHGTSLPSNPVRSLTLTPGQVRSQTPKKVPKLPNIKQCCVNKGIKHEKCLDKLCVLNDNAELEVAERSICAPWAHSAFTCLANGVDHTHCCKSRGVPEICQALCHRNNTQMDFNYFKCIKHLPTYKDCLIQGYGVLPSAPLKVRVTNIDVNYAILQWDPPAHLGDSVLNYDILVRELQQQDYKIICEVMSPYVLEDLQSGTLYEVFVEASNIHGKGDSSQRIVFNTQMKKFQAQLESEENVYNLTACCTSAGLSSTCMPLCSYDARMTKVKSLAGECGPELYKLVRCGAGGRNHIPCCSRRGVPAKCQPLCSGVVIEPLAFTAINCVPYIGNIAQCFEEGTRLIPGQISNLRATRITDSEVYLVWEPPTEGANLTDYVIHYKKVNSTSMRETVLNLDNQKNTSTTSDKLSGLETGNLYNIFVVARNQYGTSLPSSILHIKVKETDLGASGLFAVTSAPHCFYPVSSGSTFATITWQPPKFSHLAEQLLYRVFHKSSSERTFRSSDTSLTTYTLENLIPNSDDNIYVIAISKKGQSLPTETLPLYYTSVYL